jgi:uncharacterized protein
VSSNRKSRLRFNFGFMLEADLGTSRTMELDYPSIEIEDVILRPLTGEFQAIRNSNGIYVTGELQSAVGVQCARCLIDMEIPISIKLDDLFYYPPETTPTGEFSVGEDGFIDLGPLVRQLSLLEIPMQPFCRPDCKGLCVECGQNLNESSCDCDVEYIDLRLEALRSLINPSSENPG